MILQEIAFLILSLRSFYCFIYLFIYFLAPQVNHVAQAMRLLL